MGRLLAMVGSGIGSTSGWGLGARFGLMAAFMVSTVGAGVGLYYGAKIAREMLH